MSRPLNIFILESADELKQLMHAQQKAKLKERIQVLYLLLDFGHSLKINGLQNESSN